MKRTLFILTSLFIVFSCTKEKSESAENLENQLQNEFVYPATGNQKSNSLTVNQDTLFVLGTTQLGQNGSDDFELLKITKDGELINRTHFGGIQEDDGRKVLLLNDGNLLLVGTSNSYGIGDNDVLVIKAEQNGSIIWQQVIGGPNNESAIDAIENTNGNIEIIGATESYGNGSQDIYLITLDPLGSIVSEKTYGSVTVDGARKLIQADTSLFVFGHTYGYGAADRDFYLLELNQSRDSVQGHLFGGNGYEESQDIVQLSDTNFLLVGHSSSLDPNHDMFVANVTRNGNTLWSKYYGGFAHDGAETMVSLTANKFLLIGRSNSIGAGGQDILIYTIDNTGTILSEQNYGGATDEAPEEAVLLDGYVYVAGYKENPSTGQTDCYLLKVDQ